MMNMKTNFIINFNNRVVIKPFFRRFIGTAKENREEDKTCKENKF